MKFFTGEEKGGEPGTCSRGRRDGVIPSGTMGSEVGMTRSDALRAIINEAASARSALCENELVIRLDNILAIARAALEEQEGDEMPQPSRKPDL